jgi:hypothetical protein
MPTVPARGRPTWAASEGRGRRELAPDLGSREMCEVCFDSNNPAGDNAQKVTGCANTWSPRLGSPGRWETRFSRALKALGQARLTARARPREMITLKHLLAAGAGIHISLTAGLAKWILLILLVVVVAGVVAIWNRSSYRP